MCSGEESNVMLYFGQETEEVWQIAKSGHSEEGASIWLPNSTYFDIKMVRASSRGQKADEEEKMSNSPAPGVLISFSWLVNPKTVISMPFTSKSKNFCLAVLVLKVSTPH